MPEISVIVPVYKAEAFLKTCADSVLSQSFSDLELLLVEDGSPDGSGALCDSIAAADPRVRVFHKENGGVSSARNLGMAEARGTYIAFADADDWLPLDALEKLHAALTAAGADTAGGAHEMVWPDGGTVREPGALPPGVYGPDQIRTGLVDRLIGDRLGKPGDLLNGFIWRFLFSRSIIHDGDIRFDGAYLEDELFLIEYFCHAGKLAMIDETVYEYLQNPVSVTRRYLPDYMDTFQRFFQGKQALVDRYGLGEAQPLWRENTCWSCLLIAVANEFAASNPASLREKRARVRAICARPEMAQAIHAIRPKDLGRNKQVVADLISKGRFFLLSLLYWYKNRG